MKLLFTIFLCLGFKLVSATAIVIYITPDFVIMAADSKGVYTNAKTYEKTNNIVAKIYKTGNVYFSLAGLTSNSARSFNVAGIVNNTFKRTTNFDTAIASIKKEVQQALQLYLAHQRKTNIALYKSNLEAGAYLTSIGIISIINYKPYAHIIGFKVTEGKEVKVTVEEDFYASNATRDAVYYLGSSDAIHRYVNTITGNDMKPVDFVDKLMNLQITKTPELVGLPVDMIMITPNKTEWIRRKTATPVEL